MNVERFTVVTLSLLLLWQVMLFAVAGESEGKKEKKRLLIILFFLLLLLPSRLKIKSTKKTGAALTEVRKHAKLIRL